MNPLNPRNAQWAALFRGCLIPVCLCLIVLGSGQLDRAIANPRIIIAGDAEMTRAQRGNETFFSQVSDDLDELLQDIKRQFKKFSEDLRKIPESEGFKRLEKEWKRLLDKIKRAEKLVRHKFQKEILTRLKEELQKLKEKFQKQKKKKEVKPLEV